MVASRIKAAGLTIKPSKRFIGQSKVSFLGQEESGAGAQPRPVKVEAVDRFLVSSTLRTVKSFPGLTGYYRRYSRDYAKVADPLIRPTEKDVPFVWGDQQETSFQVLKKLLTVAPILSPYNPKLPIELTLMKVEYGLELFCFSEQSQEKS